MIHKIVLRNGEGGKSNIKRLSQALEGLESGDHWRSDTVCLQLLVEYVDLVIELTWRSFGCNTSFNF